MDQHDSAPRTGHPEVDAVLHELEGLAGLPLSEHVPTLDAAHARLRSLLTDAGRSAADEPA